MGLSSSISPLDFRPGVAGRVALFSWQQKNIYVYVPEAMELHEATLEAYHLQSSSIAFDSSDSRETRLPWESIACIVTSSP